MRSGLKSSEFYLSLAATIIGALTASGVFPSDSPYQKLLGVAACVLASLGYTWSRTAIKKSVQDVKQD